MIKSDDEAIIWDFLGTIYNPYENCLFDKGRELLVKLQENYKQVLVSAAGHIEKRRKLLRSLDIEDCFDQIELGQKTAELFSNICNEFNVKPENVYVIGDNASNEIRIGNELNMRTIWVDRIGKSRSKEKSLEIRYWKKIAKLYELEGILKLP